MGVFASFCSQNYTQFPNGGREGCFSVNFTHLTIMGAIGGVLGWFLPVFASKCSQNHTQNANRGEGGVIMCDF